VLDRLRDIRTITDRNARDLKETRGGTANLLRDASELAGLVPAGNGKRSGSTGARTTNSNGKSQRANGRG
jgi:hypothetical protein